MLGISAIAQLPLAGFPSGAKIIADPMITGIDMTPKFSAQKIIAKLIGEVEDN